MAGSHPDEDDPASDLIDRWMSHRKEEPALPPPPVATQRASAPQRPVAPPPDPAPITRRVGRSTNHDFAPRRGARGAVGVLLLIAFAGLVVAGMVAAQEQTTLTFGVAGTLFVVVLALWAIRASSPVAHLSVHAGRLEVEQGGQRSVFELGRASFTPIEVRGRPGDRSWKVVFARRGMEPFVVDSSMVDPHEFMDVLRRYRPE